MTQAGEEWCVMARCYKREVLYAGRRGWVCLAAGLAAGCALLAGCSKDGEAEDEACDWPQPFDGALTEAVRRKVSAAVCTAEVDEYVDRLKCAELMADAAVNELLLQAIYMPRLASVEGPSYVSAGACRDVISTIRLDAAEWPYPAACGEVRQAFLDAMKRIERLYDGMEYKGRRWISWEVRRSQRAVNRYRELAAALQPLPELKRPEPFPITAHDYVHKLICLETTPWSPPAAVMAEWNRLVEANVPDDDPAMRRVLRQMDRPTCPYPWENKRHYVPPQFSGKYDYWTFNYLDELGCILTNGKYQAFLFDAFVSWRGNMQSDAFGGSNYSGMPNNDYNIVRFIAVRTIQQHLRKHPEDGWARIQKAGLLSASNIKRGGMFGSVSGFESEELLDVLTPRETAEK